MINLTIDEREAIENLDVEVLRRAIDEARQGRNSAALTQLQLHRLGSFVQSAERRFTNALDDLRKAKAAANISKKEQAAVRAGWDLISSVDQMKERAEQERRDGVRFYIDDHIREPYRPNRPEAARSAKVWNICEHSNPGQVFLVLRVRRSHRLCPPGSSVRLQPTIQNL